MNAVTLKPLINFLIIYNFFCIIIKYISKIINSDNDILTLQLDINLNDWQFLSFKMRIIEVYIIVIFEQLFVMIMADKIV
jgi:hypothetical protein